MSTTTTVPLSPDPDRFHLATTPTFFPNNVESVVNTRASAANSERRGKLVREVTVQYNLRNEPWLKYSSAAVADRGFKRSEWTAARLRSESLYLESHAHRYELSFEGDPNACDEEGKGLASEDKYRFRAMRRASNADGDDEARRAAPERRARTRESRFKVVGRHVRRRVRGRQRHGNQGGAAAVHGQ